MYLGEFDCKIDYKNRLFVPAKFKKKDSDLIITYINQSTIIVCDSLEVLKNLFSCLNDDVKKKMLEYTYINSYTVHVDSQGRMLIPNSIKLGYNEVMVVGRGNYFVICNKELYLEEKNRLNIEVQEYLESNQGKEFTRGLVFRK